LPMENTDTAVKDKLPQRIGVVGIVLENPASCSQNVNRLLSRYAFIIKGRMGLPFGEHNIAVISLIVQGSTDSIGALTGSLGQIPGVTVKSALTSKSLEE